MMNARSSGVRGPVSPPALLKLSYVGGGGGGSLIGLAEPVDILPLCLVRPIAGPFFRVTHLKCSAYELVGP